MRSKRLFIVALIFMTFTISLYMNIKGFSINSISGLVVVIYGVYSIFGIVAAWKLLTFRFEVKIHPYLRRLYYIPRFGFRLYWFGLFTNLVIQET